MIFYLKIRRGSKNDRKGYIEYIHVQVKPVAAFFVESQQPSARKAAVIGQHKYQARIRATATEKKLTRTRSRRPVDGRYSKPAGL